MGWVVCLVWHANLCQGVFRHDDNDDEDEDEDEDEDDDHHHHHLAWPGLSIDVIDSNERRRLRAVHHG